MSDARWTLILWLLVVPVATQVSDPLWPAALGAFAVAALVDALATPPGERWID